MFKKFLFIALISCHLSAFAFLEDVANLRVTQTGENFAEIKFDEVLDATNYTLLIGTNSVSSSAESYNLPPIIMGGNLEYRVSNLKPDTTYFMRVFAENANDKSENLSDEISVNLSQLKTNILPSQITDLIVLDSRNVQIAFEKDMQFNEETIKTLRLFKKFDGNEILIQNIEIIDQKNIKLFIKQNLDPNFDYELHILPDLLDIDANPLSAEKLVANFNTTDQLSEYVDLTNLPDLKIVSAVAFDQSAFEVEFSHEIKKDPSLRSRVKIFRKDNQENLDVVDVLFNELEPKKILIVTTQVEETDYVIEVKDVQSEQGKIITPADSRINVLNKPKANISEIPAMMELPPIMEVAPTQVSEISGVKGTIDSMDNSKLQLSFNKPTDKEIKEIKVFLESEDGKTFDLIDVVSKDLSKVILELGTPVRSEKNLKVVAVDNNGNESEGIITKLLIPETGPAAALATLIGSGLLGAVVSRRRK